MSLLNNLTTSSQNTMPPLQNTMPPMQNTMPPMKNTMQPMHNMMQPMHNMMQPMYNMTKYDEEEEVVEKTNIEIVCKDSTGKYIYLIFHIIMSFIAIYLSWKCNNGKFNILTFLIALFFPYIYIVYILATKGTCDRI